MCGIGGVYWSRRGRYTKQSGVSTALRLPVPDHVPLGDLIRRLLHERFRDIREWLDPAVKIDDLFSNAQLNRRPAAFAEATTLIWLADKAA